MADLGIDAWPRMTTQSTGGGQFQAGRNNRGAFATGKGANARNVEAGGSYTENNYYGITSGSATLKSFLSKEHKNVVINGISFFLGTRDAVLLKARRCPKSKQKPDGTSEIDERIHVFFRMDDGSPFDALWPDSSFPCSEGWWITFLTIQSDEKEQIHSFCLHNRSDLWYKWPCGIVRLKIPLPRQKASLLLLSNIFISLVLLASLFLQFYTSMVFKIWFVTVFVSAFVLFHEKGKLDDTLVRARQLVQFHRLEQ